MLNPNLTDPYNQTVPEDRIEDVDDDFLVLTHVTEGDGTPTVHVTSDNNLLLVMTSVHLDDAIEVLTNVKRQLRKREREFYIEQKEAE